MTGTVDVRDARRAEQYVAELLTVFDSLAHLCAVARVLDARRALPDGVTVTGRAR